ncbi:MAG: double-strand break repair protein AddB, partial [Alphaproteobacteria bacterium]
AELRRWNIEIDDSAGQPLAGTSAGIFLRCLLEAVESRFAPAALLGLLKHELCRLDMAPEKRRMAVSALERRALRGLKPAPGLDALRKRLEHARKRGKDVAAPLTLIKRLEAATAPLVRLAEHGAARLCELARAHLEAADTLAGTGTGESWDGDDGAAARAFLEDLAAQEDGPEWSLPEYAAAVARCLQARAVHARRPGHPRLFIWGPLEARLQHADVMILGGLNEGTWPAPPAPDPWLNRHMQGELGLPDPERRVGQAAHDFTQLASAEEVYLTRSEKVEGTPQLPSRWLLRLDAVLKAAGAEAGSLTPDEPLTEIFRQMDRRRKRERIADPRPAPPAEARPKQLSVTAVETLVRDPYAIYARHVLKLRALEPLEGEPGPGERGAFVHDALRRFIARFPDGLPADRSAARAALFEEGEAALKRAIGPERVHPVAHRFWRARFEAAGEWFLDWEYARRAAGAAPLLLEAKGALDLDAGQGFTLIARADRIDRLAAGGHAIIDYKTGRAPSDKEVGAGFAPQLPLEGAILEAGGFEDAEAGAAHALLYVTLGGGRTPGEERPVTGGAGSAEACVAEALAGLKSLIAQYHDPSTPFLSRPHVQFLAHQSDYDHLARVKEWSAGGEETAE